MRMKMSRNRVGSYNGDIVLTVLVRLVTRNPPGGYGSRETRSMTIRLNDAIHYIISTSICI